jgi:hypothetical protein
VTGAIEGMALATVLNGLTARTSVKTVVRIQGTSCELFLLDTSATPDQLRIEMSVHSAPSGRCGQRRWQKGHSKSRAVSPSPVEELAKLADLLEKGLLTP